MKNYILYVTSVQHSFSFPKLEEDNWEKLFNHHNFDYKAFDLSPFTYNHPIERILLVQTEAKQHELEKWLYDWSQSVKDSSFLLTPIDDNLSNLSYSKNFRKFIKEDQV